MPTILIVDDRPINREYLTTLVGYAGYRTTEAADGLEALARVQAERPDLVITDILMPNMDGFEFVQRLRAQPETAAIAVIFYSATYRIDDAQKLAQACGVREVLAKPSEPQDILNAVTRALGVNALPGSAALPAATLKPAPESGRANLATDRFAGHFKELQEARRLLDQVSQQQRAKPEAEREKLKQYTQYLLKLQQTSGRINAIVELGLNLMGERDPQRLLKMMFEGACSIMPSQGAALTLSSIKDVQSHQVFTKGVAAEILASATVQSVFGKSLPARRRVRLEGGSPGSGGLPAGHSQTASILAVSVASDTREYGWLYFARTAGTEGFTAEDEQVVKTLVIQSATLYENALLYDMLQRHAAQLQLELAQYRLAEAPVIRDP